MSELKHVIAGQLYDCKWHDRSVDEVADLILDSVKQALTEKTLSLKAVSHDRRVFIQIIEQVLEKEL